MAFKKCPTDDCLNYMDDKQDLCDVCKERTTGHTDKIRIDDNKSKVERDLLPILRSFSVAGIQSLTTKKESFDLLGLRLPLLVECRGFGGDACKKEIITDVSKVYRYYVQPYDINGKKYHICSQWWSAAGNNSKDILKLLKEIKDKS